jgi:hypothetical protein
MPVEVGSTPPAKPRPRKGTRKSSRGGTHPHIRMVPQSDKPDEMAVAYGTSYQPIPSEIESDPMKLTIDLDVLDGAAFVVRWDDLSAAIIAKLSSEFGTEPEECDFDPEGSESGMVKCYYKARGNNVLDIPFCIEFDLGRVAERIAHRIVNHPALTSKGYRLIGGSICTEENGDIRIYPNNSPE